ncbi:MAG TPA: F0F1 ATP synthase subunit B [Candidatus Binatia bacterium]|jgi:F-type H+-transporting ATPase subunit b|nr:F0F1 ATP synthase subunit B [Candidatus Binatia bacterium]
MVTEAKQVAESTGVLGTLGINGKLFLAQLVNFGIVFFVMWKWVYTPLLKIMDERTKKIEQGMSDAEAAGALLRASEDQGAKAIADARKAAKAILDEAAAAAETERQEASKKARLEVEKIVAQGRDQLKAEQRKMVSDAKAEVGALVAMAAEKVLREKIDPKKDAALIAQALKEAEPLV